MQKRKVKEIFGASIVARAGTDLTVPVKKSRMGEWWVNESLQNDKGRTWSWAPGWRAEFEQLVEAVCGNGEGMSLNHQKSKNRRFIQKHGFSPKSKNYTPLGRPRYALIWT